MQAIINSLLVCNKLIACIILHLQPPEVWDGGVGFVTKEMIQEHCPAPASDIQVDFELCSSKFIIEHCGWRKYCEVIKYCS